MIEVYHGGTEAINRPLVSAGREGLDFGKGFYVTLLREQAELWADRMARQRNHQICILNQQAIDEYLHFKEAIQC